MKEIFRSFALQFLRLPCNCEKDFQKIKKLAHSSELYLYNKLRSHMDMLIKQEEDLTPGILSR